MSDIVNRQIVHTLMMAHTLGQSIILAYQSARSVLPFLFNVIPQPVTHGEYEKSQLKTYDSASNAQQSTLKFSASLYLMIYCLPVDTISSVLSLVCKCIVSMVSPLVDLCQEDKNRIMFTK